MSSNISGFPELSPPEQLLFTRLQGKIQKIFETYGFSPLDTAAVEKFEDLTSKGDDKEIYLLTRLEEGQQKKKIGLRFDLTVPLARYISQRYGEITFPYRRYHIAPVWRGERSQSGRYRQFYQADVDIIGESKINLSNDAELISVASKALQTILNDLGSSNKSLIMRINHTQVLSRILQLLSIPDDLHAPVTRIIDKQHKISASQLNEELQKLDLAPIIIDKIENFIAETKKNLSITMDEENFSVHKALYPEITVLSSHADDAILREALQELETIWTDAQLIGLHDLRIVFDPTLARGLNYYTGLICEVSSLEYPALGSICGGGRYANLVNSFGKRDYPGVGLSIGLSRLFIHFAQNIGEKLPSTTALVLVTMQVPNLRNRYIELAKYLRSCDISTEIYLEDKPLPKQLSYADKKGHVVAIIASENELNEGKVIVRHLTSGKQKHVDINELQNEITSILFKGLAI